MIEAAEKILKEFETLPDEARSEVVAAMARRVAQLPHDLPDDDDLTASADRLFLELDGRVCEGKCDITRSIRSHGSNSK